MQCGRHIDSGANANNMKSMHINAYGHIVDLYKFL